jgi:small nuclear ribonucleoprotein (snRNP)-like protein
MNKRTLAIHYLLVALLTISSTAAAQTAAQTDPAWDAVKAMPYGEPLTVKLKGGTTVEGTMISASDTHLKMYKTEESPTSGIVYEDIVDIKKRI